MGLLDDIRGEIRATGPQSCILHRVLSELADVDAAGLRTAIDDPNVPSTAIERALKKNGHPISDSTIRKFREQGCHCAAS